MSERKTRVRFAPSPTGPLHMGGIRTALFNYLFAKKHQGDFILRIEDTDQARYVEGAEKYIIESLKWCGLEMDEGPFLNNSLYGPYRQSERKHLYREYADQLILSGNAYYAFDTSEDLESMRLLAKKAKMPNWQYNFITRTSMKNSLSLSKDDVEKRMKNKEPYTIRVKMPRDQDIRFYDEIRGWVIVNTNNMDDKVIFKADGMPTYHFANVVDDHDMKITSVVRGEEWLSSFPSHVTLYKHFGWSPPKFYHLPLILKSTGQGKLSKRDAEEQGHPIFAVQWEESKGFKESGYTPEGILNYLALLGWNSGTENEIFSCISNLK